MKSLVACICAAAVAAAAAQDTTALDEVARTAKAPPRLTLQASAADVLAACRDMLPMRPIKLTGALILRNRKGIVQKECDYSLVMQRSLEETRLLIQLFARHETNELASVEISRRGKARPDVTVVHVAVRLNGAYQPVVKDVGRWHIKTGHLELRDIDFHGLGGWIVEWDKEDWAGKRPKRQDRHQQTAVPAICDPGLFASSPHDHDRTLADAHQRYRRASAEYCDDRDLRELSPQKRYGYGFLCWINKDVLQDPG